MNVYDEDRRLRVTVFFSGGASGLRYLAEHDPNYNHEYEVVGAFTDTPDAAGVDLVKSLDIPLESNDIKMFYRERDADIRDLDVRREFDSQTRDAIQGWDADLILLSGYMRILTQPVVEQHPIINVHPADLRIEREGDRAYTGFDPVWDAVVAGEKETRSSVHFVTEDVDDGPVLVVSRAFEVHRELADTLHEFGADDALRSYVDSHQEWMKWLGDGPALAKALELIAGGDVELRDNEVFVDGEQGPYLIDG